jgi:hypothetical protein
MRFLPEFLTEYPLDRAELMAAWKEYFEQKQPHFHTICNDIEKIPFFVYAQEKREQLKLSQAKMFVTEVGLDLENISMLDIAKIMSKHWRGWYGGKEDILTQVAFLDLQYGLMEGNIFICQNCRSLFLRPERGPEPSFCSSRCQNQYYYRKRLPDGALHTPADNR